MFEVFETYCDFYAGLALIVKMLCHIDKKLCTWPDLTFAMVNVIHVDNYFLKYIHTHATEHSLDVLTSAKLSVQLVSIQAVGVWEVFLYHVYTCISWHIGQ